MGASRFFIINDGFHYLSALLWFISYVQYTKQFHSGTKSLAVAGTTTMVLMHTLSKKEVFEEFLKMPKVST